MATFQEGQFQKMVSIMQLIHTLFYHCSSSFPEILRGSCTQGGDLGLSFGTQFQKHAGRRLLMILICP